MVLTILQIGASFEWQGETWTRLQVSRIQKFGMKALRVLFSKSDPLPWKIRSSENVVEGRVCIDLYVGVGRVALIFGLQQVRVVAFVVNECFFMECWEFF